MLNVVLNLLEQKTLFWIFPPLPINIVKHAHRKMYLNTVNLMDFVYFT